MLISICIPCYRSTLTLEAVVLDIKREFQLHEEYECQVILVNDGSPDNTFDVIKKLCREDKRIVGVNLSKNSGQAAARLAALPYADGEIIVYMDDDGQHPVSGIFELIGKLQEGYDVVYAKFTGRKHSGFKRVTSRLKKRIAEAAGTKPKGIDTSPFAAWSRTAVNAVKEYKSPFPSTGSYLRCITDKFANVEVEHRARIAGKSGYNFKKLFGLWLTGLTNFSIVPLRLASFCGVFCATIGFFGGIAVIIRKLIYPAMAAGYASTIVVILFIGGMIMMMLGLIGEYIGRIYMILSNKPQYVINRTVNADGGDKDE